MAIHVTDADFEEVVLKSDVPVMVDFWAEWCGPCKMIGPIVDELSGEFEGKAKMVKVDVDNNSETAMKYGIRNIPTLLFFKGGEQVDKQVGVVAKAALAEKIQGLL
jgi:thioredoxin 1